MKNIFVIKSNNITKLSALLLSVILGISGCNNPNVKSDGNKNIKTIKITMIAKSAANPVFLSAKTGALKTAEALDQKYSKLKAVIDWRTPEYESASEQAEIIRAAVRNGTNAIIVSCSDEDTLTSAINYAVDNGVEVMTFDSDAPKSKRFAFYGPDDFEIGKTLINELAKLIGGKGKIAILGGNKMANNLQQRVKGIIQGASDYPNIEIIGTYFHTETEEEAIAVISEVMKLNPDLKGWAMVGSWAFFGERLKNIIEPGKVKIVTVDALPIQLEYIEKNYVQVLLGQPTFTWGEISVQTVIDKIYFKKPVKEIIRLKTIPVTIENLGGWSRQLRAWGYNNIPDKYLVM